MQLTQIHSMSRVISMSHAIAYDSQAVAGTSKQLKQGCGRALVKYLLHWTVGPDILREIFTIWLITFNRNAFDVAKIGADLFVYICDVTFEIRARAERHVIGTREKSRLNKSQTFIKQATPSKNIPTCWSTDVSYLCRTCVEQCASELQLLITQQDQLCCRHGKQMTPVWRSSISRAQSLAKTAYAHFRDRGWRRLRYLPRSKRGDMAT